MFRWMAFPTLYFLAFLIRKWVFQWESRLNQQNVEKLINFSCLFVYFIDEREIFYDGKSDI